MADADTDELRRGWPVVLACFVMAILGWGFGFYGQAVYVAQLQLLHGWSASLISSATTAYYLSGAFLLSHVAAAIERLGPRTVLSGGSVVMAAGATLVAWSASPWQLFAGSLVMGVGWACTSSTAIATTLALWFDRRRGLAISLALNGASVAGFTVAPALVQLSAGYGLVSAVPRLGAGMLVVVVPLLLLTLGGARPIHATTARPAGGTGRRIHVASRAQALGSFRFWSIAAPFALALMAQVGFIVHQVAFLLPKLGPGGVGIAVSGASVAAMLGRLGLGVIIDRLDNRRASAITFLVQVAALLLMLALPDRPAALYVGCIAFGLSVGNVITLPSLITQREFAAGSFGLIVGLSTAIGQVAYSFSPSLLGVVHDLTGGYAPVLMLCAAFDTLAAVLVLRPGKPL